MRSKKLKLMVGALLVTMVGATFVGCGSNSSEGENNTASNRRFSNNFNFRVNFSRSINGKNSRKI